MTCKGCGAKLNQRSGRGPRSEYCDWKCREAKIKERRREVHDGDSKLRDDHPRRFFEGKPINWPLKPEDPCTPGWLSVQFLVRGRPAWEIAHQLDCTPEQVHAMLERLGISNPSIARTVVPSRLLSAVAATHGTTSRFGLVA